MSTTTQSRPPSALFRVGVRLYDSKLGRFLEVDPVEGGSCNDYDYVCGDPVNGYDLAGTCSSKLMNALQLKACQQDEAKRNAAAAKKKAAEEAAARARRMTEKDKRMDVVRPEPRNNPFGDYLATALHPVGAAIHATAGRVTRAAVGCATFAGPGAVAGGAIGVPFGVAPATATAGAAGGCIGGAAYGLAGPEYPAP